MSGQIRIFAYFSNLVLLAAFLGMGLGLALGRRRPGLVHAALPALAVFSAILAFAEDIGLVSAKFPDPAMSLWGGESGVGLAGFAGATLLVVGLFWGIACVFLFAAAPVGWLFDRLPPLRAYGADLVGSLLGVVALTILAALGTSPVFWMAAVVIPLVLLSPRPTSFVSAAAVLVLAGLSVRGALFSPYNRIDLVPLRLSDEPAGFGEKVGDFRLQANRDYHQDVLDLSAKAVAATSGSARRRYQEVYELPFRLQSNRGSALVVGAGTGNDVAAALRVGYESVKSVEIDPTILRVGASRHPERPYANPRVTPVVNDARAYFEQSPDERFDVVCYGLLDSHAMFSSMSSLRLENYVYTVEGIRAGWRHVKDDGILAISYSVYAGDWIAKRMLGIVEEATGLQPITVPHMMNFGMTYVVGRRLDPALVARLPVAPASLSRDPSVRIPTDDWPFTYLKPGRFPWAYVAVLTMIIATATFAVKRAYGLGKAEGALFDAPLFLMGAAFMLLETRMVTELSLLFGATWAVNASVFAGILVMVLVANAIVVRKPPSRVAVWYVPLASALLLTWLFGAGTLNSLPILARGIVGGLLFALPVAFAGVIFSSLLAKSVNAASSLGSNLLGAVVGGALEYTSMLVGLRALALLALALYLGSLLLVLRRVRPVD